MTQQHWKVYFYEKRNGRRPAEDFLDDLTYEEYARMDRKIEYLKAFGPNLRRPHADSLRDKIHELRAECLNVQLRILYWRDGSRFLLSHGLRKKSGPVPDFQIDKAVEHRTDYFARKEEKSR